MKIAVMQPYFLPYLGYFQLISSVDTFVLADTYQYTKQSWINRNRLILENRLDYFGLPIQKQDSNSLILESKISKIYSPDKVLYRIRNSYRNQENWINTEQELLNLLNVDTDNLYEYLEFSIKHVLKKLKINTQIIKLSEIEMPNNLSGQSRVIQICKLLGGKEYINLPGGKSLYSTKAFSDEGLYLRFIDPLLLPYKQNIPGFTSHLSIIDLNSSLNWEGIVRHHLPSFQINSYQE